MPASTDIFPVPTPNAKCFVDQTLAVVLLAPKNLSSQKIKLWDNYTDESQDRPPLQRKVGKGWSKNRSFFFGRLVTWSAMKSKKSIDYGCCFTKKGKEHFTPFCLPTAHPAAHENSSDCQNMKLEKQPCRSWIVQPDLWGTFVCQTFQMIFEIQIS